MALKIAKGKQLPIGVDLGTSETKLAQLRHLEGQTELIAAGSVAVCPANDGSNSQRLSQLAKAIKDIMGKQPFKGRQAVLSIPAAETFVRHIKIPRVAPDDVAQTVKWELDGKLPYPVEESVIRQVVAGDAYGEGESKLEVIAVAARRKTVEDYLAMARKAHLDVLGINIEPCAIAECFSRLFRRQDDQKRTILFIDMGWASTQVVLTRGSQLVFARNLLSGGKDLDAAVAEGMGIGVQKVCQLRRQAQTDTPPDEADQLYQFMDEPLRRITDELSQCLNYHEAVFRNESSVERAIFIGGQAFDKKLCQSIAQRLNLPAQIGDPLVRVNRAPGCCPQDQMDQREPQPNWAVAVGLSLGGGRAA